VIKPQDLRTEDSVTGKLILVRHFPDPDILSRVCRLLCTPSFSFIRRDFVGHSQVVYFQSPPLSGRPT